MTAFSPVTDRPCIACDGDGNQGAEYDAPCRSCRGSGFVRIAPPAPPRSAMDEAVASARRLHAGPIEYRALHLPRVAAQLRQMATVARFADADLAESLADDLARMADAMEGKAV